MFRAPIAPINRNQRSTMGAKSHPTLSVPQCCKLNKPINITTATSTTTSETLGIKGEKKAIIHNDPDLDINKDKDTKSKRTC